MQCIGYTISDAAGNYPHKVQYKNRKDAERDCDFDAGEDVGFVWEDGSVTFDGLPP